MRTIVSAALYGIVVCIGALALADLLSRLVAW